MRPAANPGIPVPMSGLAGRRKASPAGDVCAAFEGWCVPDLSSNSPRQPVKQVVPDVEIRSAQRGYYAAHILRRHCASRCELVKQSHKADAPDADPPGCSPCLLVTKYASCHDAPAPHLYARQNGIALPEFKPLEILAKIKHFPAPVHARDANDATIKKAADHCPDIRADQLLTLYVRRDDQFVPQ